MDTSKSILTTLHDKIKNESQLDQIWDYYFDHVPVLSKQLNASVARGTIEYPALDFTIKLVCKQKLKLDPIDNMLFKLNDELYHGLIHCPKHPGGTVLYSKIAKRGLIIIINILNQYRAEHLRFSLASVIPYPENIH